MTSKKYDKIIAGAIIYRYNNGVKEVLAIRRSQYSSYSGEWEFSRGRVDEKDATGMDAAKREAKEETGLDVIPYQLLDKYEYRKDENGKSTHVLQKNYLCKPVSMNSKVVLDIKEHDRFRWIQNTDELPDLPSEIKETMNKVLKDEVVRSEKTPKIIVGESVVFDL